MKRFFWRTKWNHRHPFLPTLNTQDWNPSPFQQPSNNIQLCKLNMNKHHPSTKPWRLYLSKSLPHTYADIYIYIYIYVYIYMYIYIYVYIYTHVEVSSNGGTPKKLSKITRARLSIETCQVTWGFPVRKEPIRKMRDLWVISPVGPVQHPNGA